MSKNKNASIRYQTLDKCFRNSGRRYYIEDLVKECNKAILDLEPGASGVKKRQIFSDIKYMESAQGWSVPLESVKDGRRAYYRYSDRKFSINNQPFNETEINQLKSVLVTLSRFKGLPQFEWINEILLKLNQSFKISETQKEIVGFDHNEFLQGLDYLGDLFNAITYHKIVQISYRPYQATTPSVQSVHPYYLKQYNGRWFLLGFSERYPNLSVFALDRIESMEETDATFQPDQSIDFSEYFDDIIGVSKTDGEQLTKIELFVTPQQVPYILTKPLHGSQKKVSQTEAGTVFSIEVIPNYELEQMILSHGEKITVLSPVSFRERMKARLERALLGYG